MATLGVLALVMSGAPPDAVPRRTLERVLGITLKINAVYLKGKVKARINGRRRKGKEETVEKEEEKEEKEKGNTSQEAGPLRGNPAEAERATAKGRQVPDPCRPTKRLSADFTSKTNARLARIVVTTITRLASFTRQVNVMVARHVCFLIGIPPCQHLGLTTHRPLRAIRAINQTKAMEMGLLPNQNPRRKPRLRLKLKPKPTQVRPDRPPLR